MTKTKKQQKQEEIATPKTANQIASEYHKTLEIELTAKIKKELQEKASNAGSATQLTGIQEKIKTAIGRLTNAEILINNLESESAYTMHYYRGLLGYNAVSRNLADFDSLKHQIAAAKKELV